MSQEFDFTDYTKILFQAGALTRKQFKDINYGCSARRKQLDRMEEVRIRELGKILDEGQ